MKITWYGTASITAETKETKLLFDPFVPWRGSPAPIRCRDFDRCSQILVTHGHFDHIESLPAIVKRNPDASIYCTKTPYRTLMKNGIPKEHLKRLRPGRRFSIGDISLAAYRSRHADLQFRLSDRILDPRLIAYRYNLLHMLYANLKFPENNETLMYEVMAEGKKMLLLGSMNLDDNTDYPSSCDVLILPYVGYFDNYAAAVRIIERLGPKKVILSHFDDTFPPLTRPVDTSKILKYDGCEIIIPDYKTPVEL